MYFSSTLGLSCFFISFIFSTALYSLGHAGILSEPAPTLKIRSELSLPFLANGSVYSPESRSFFVFEQNTSHNHVSRIVEFSSSSLEQLRQIEIAHSILSWELSPELNSIFVVGNIGAEGFGAISRIPLGNEPIATVKLSHRFEQPSLSASTSEYLYVSDTNTSKIWSIGYANLGIVQRQFNKNEEDFGQLSFGSSRIRPLQIIVSSQDNVIFITDNATQKVYAVELRGFNQTLSVGNFNRASSSAYSPITMLVNRDKSGKFSRSITPTVFAVLVGYPRDQPTIAILRYDTILEGLDLVTTAKTGHRARQSKGKEPNSRGDTVHPMLLAWAVDQNLILSAHTNSRDLVQFSSGRNNFGPLEKLNTLRLPDFPKDIAISDDGSHAVIVLKRGNRALILSRDTSENQIKHSGKNDIRTLQEQLKFLGFPVGDVDGVDGSKTQSAIRFANKTFDLNISSKDIKFAGSELKPYIARHNMTVYIQFSGYSREKIVALATGLENEGWNVPSAKNGGERLPAATEKAEIRHGPDADMAIIRQLAKHVTDSGIVKSVKIRSLKIIRDDFAEIWIGK